MKWNALTQTIKNEKKDWNGPNFPFTPDALIRDYNKLYSKIYDKEKYVNM